MDVETIVVETLDTLAALIVLPEVAGSERLERLREAVATQSDRPVRALLRIARWFAQISGALLALWFVAGFVPGLGDLLDQGTFALFHAHTFAARARAIAGLLAILTFPLLIAGLIALVAIAVRGALWVPSRIAQRTSLSRILAVIGLLAFLCARTIAISIAI